MPGDWTWNRLPDDLRTTALDWLIGLVTLGTYAGFVALGFGMLANRASRLREGFGLALLTLAAVGVQLGLQSAAPVGFGLTKWTIALHSAGSNGYYTVARQQIDDPWRFLGRVSDLDHESRTPSTSAPTRPASFLAGMRCSASSAPARPWHGRSWRACPGRSWTASRSSGSTTSCPWPTAPRLATVGALTLLACALTVIPLYLLARTRLPAPAAWAAASLWPVVPSAILFQPTADTAFPLLATTALALAARGRRWPAALAGVVLAVGMTFTLAFLAVGLIVALILAATPADRPGQRAALIGWTGAGFLLTTLALWAFSSANPFVIWWWNSRNHARFYDQYPRDYRAWMVANPIELAVALGLPTTTWALIGLPRSGRATWATLAVLALLQFSGRNFSEVARLWLMFFPALLLAAAAGLDRCGGRAATTAATVGLVGLQTLALQATIQVVYAGL